MKIRNEYKIMLDCIERGVEYGYMRAFKHEDNPTEERIKDTIKDCVSNEILEVFHFDNEEDA